MAEFLDLKTAIAANVNSGDTVAIWDSYAAYLGDELAFANTVALVQYDDDGTVWPADNNDASIYLTDLNADPTVGGNWALSTVGTAGAFESTPNSATGNDGDVGSPIPEPATLALLAAGAALCGRRPQP